MRPLPFDIYPFLRPLLFRLDPEQAHGIAIQALRKGFVPPAPVAPDSILNTTLGDVEFAHPLGLAAGFDKQAEVIQDTLDLGFAFTEVGGVTPLPQKGNPKPRMFRIPESKALINRFNFNSDGFDACLRRVAAWYDATGHGTPRGIVGVNIAHGDNCPDAAEAYIAGMNKFARYVRFVTINVSCPNEPDARNLEGRDQLSELLRRIKDAHNVLDKKPLLLVKISPDQNEKQSIDIAQVALQADIDGMIISNTTVERPNMITSALANEKGGLSGRPLFELSTDLLGRMYQLTEGKLPLIGTGGIFNGEDAYAKIRAGASLLQIYTALVYGGPMVISRITSELASLLRRDNFSSVTEAVGADFRKS